MAAAASAMQLMAWNIAAVCAGIATLISTTHLIRHICNRAEWSVKACELKIVCMVPLYAIEAFISLHEAHSVHKFPEVLTFIREYYEAVVLISFLQLILNCLNGPKKVAEAFALHLQTPEHPMCFKSIPTLYAPGLGFLVAILCGLLQFAAAMAFVTTVGVCVWFFEVFLSTDGAEHPLVEQGMKGIKTVSCAYAMYILTLFYFELARNPGLKEKFEAIKPETKFLAIKGVIMFTIFQNMACTTAANAGLFKNITLVGRAEGKASQLEVGDFIQNFLICVEMLMFSIIHFLAYPSQEFDASSGPTTGGSVGVFAMFADIKGLYLVGQEQKKMLNKLKEGGVLQEDEVQRIFNAFDVDRSKSISKEEFSYMLKTARFSHEECEVLIERADQDHDGMITERAFMDAFSSRLQC